MNPKKKTKLPVDPSLANISSSDYLNQMKSFAEETSHLVGIKEKVSDPPS